MQKQTRNELKILFLTNWYPSIENPVEGIFVQEIVRAISLSHEVLVIHNTGPDPSLANPWVLSVMDDGPLSKGIKAYRFSYRPSPIPGTRLLKLSWFLFQALQQLKEESWIPDIIHAHVFHAGILAVLVGRIARVPVIITEHSSAFIRGLLSRSGRRIARIAYKMANVVVPVSTTLRDSIVSAGIRGNFQIIPNVVDDEIFTYKEKNRQGEEHRLLYVGLLDLSENKGIPVLFQALETFLDQEEKWHLEIIGDGPARDAYQKRLDESPLKEFVTIHGIKPKSEVANAMQNADLFILPSLKETFSVVTAEALATGTPVLVTKCGGPEDFVDESNGILVEAGDPDALYEGLLRGIDSLDSFDNEGIARNARLLFSPAVISEEYTKIYSGILSGSNK